MLGHADAQPARQAARAAHHVAVDGVAQAWVFAQLAAQRQHGAFQMAGQRRVFVGQVAPQRGVDVVPQALHVFLHLGVVDGALLQGFNLGRQGRVGLQAFDVIQHPGFVVAPHGVVGFGQHVAQLVHQGHGQPVGQVVGDAVHRLHHVHRRDDARPFFAGKLHQQRGRAFLHIVFTQVAAQALHGRVQQFLVAPVARQQAQHFADSARRVPAAQVLHHEFLDHAAHRVVIQHVQRLQRHPARAVAQGMRLLRPNQPTRQPRRGIEHAQLFHQRVRVQEVVAHEHGQVVADTVFVAGDDGGVRNRQPHRTAKQRHHREPVGQRAHRGRFAKRPHPGPCPLPAHDMAGDEAADHGHQQRQRGDFHTPQLRAARVGGQGGVRGERGGGPSGQVRRVGSLGRVGGFGLIRHGGVGVASEASA
ncbi:hypothetical protein D3C73_820010 [compost metagenome]